jgi:uncharacterized protein YcbX
MQVIEIWRYPVKSMGGERLDEATLTDLGIEGDRSWGVRDSDTGLILTARREPKLLMLSAAVGPGAPVITSAADGRRIEGDAELAAFLGRPVELVPAGEEGGTYENPMDFENDDDWMSWQGAGGAWHDNPRHRVSVVSTASLAQWDVRRFRSNVVVHGAGEDDLVGAEARLGSATVSFTRRIGRCVMVTRPQPGLDRDLDVLRTVNRERDGKLSVGALVVTPGRFAVGDELVVTERDPAPAAS